MTIELDQQIRDDRHATPTEAFAALKPEGLTQHQFCRLWYRVKSNPTRPSAQPEEASAPTDHASDQESPGPSVESPKPKGKRRKASTSPES